MQTFSLQHVTTLLPADTRSDLMQETREGNSKFADLKLHKIFFEHENLTVVSIFIHHRSAKTGQKSTQNFITVFTAFAPLSIK